MVTVQIPGFNSALMYTGEGRVDLLLQGRNLVFQTSIPPFLILISPILPPTQKNIWIYLLHILVMKKHQIKSSWYYIFWGAATLSVLIGQLHVGSGYNRLANIIEHQVMSKCYD